MVYKGDGIHLKRNLSTSGMPVVAHSLFLPFLPLSLQAVKEPAPRYNVRGLFDFTRHKLQNADQESKKSPATFEHTSVRTGSRLHNRNRQFKAAQLEPTVQPSFS